MARMIPPVVHPGTVSRGELEVFRRLQSDPETEDWTVLHSLDTAAHVKQVFGEIDFVVVVPGKGVLCLEVKGTTRLKRERGLWYYGNAAPDARGPFKQASSAMHSVREQLAKHDCTLKSIVFWSAACFPLLDFNETSVEWHSWQVIDRRAMQARSLGQLVKGVLDNARTFLAGHPSAKWFDPRSPEPSKEQCEAICHLLRPQFEIFESPKSRKHRLEEELKRYTGEQLVALDAMDSNERVIFTAPAGTGKTLLATEAARRASATGKRVLFVCFNRFLGQTLKAQLESLQSVTAGTLHSYMLSLTGLSGEDRDRAFWEGDLPLLATEKLLELDDAPFDELIVDEAQDILKDAYLDVLDMSLKGGLAAGRWRIFGDFEKQLIYGTGSTALQGFAETRGGRAPVYSLRVNCRNTPHIATTARWLGQMHPDYSRVLRPDNGVEAELSYFRDSVQQQQLLIDALQNLYDDGFQGDDIVVLSPRSRGACAASITQPPWSDRLTPFRLGLDGHIGYCSIHAFKGLEAPAVIVTDIEQVEDIEVSHLFYVALTRALHRLIILSAESARVEIITTLRRALGATA